MITVRDNQNKIVMKSLLIHRLINAKKTGNKHYLIIFCEETGLSLADTKRRHKNNWNQNQKKP